ncbi:MAG: hypothetical protein K2W78_00850 [Xanthobacteraceae bacterium]|nr:hypothetical protein [Xanthobacteraceae bacterium]
MPGFENKDRIALYTHLRAFESDFDKSQSQIRAICSAWSAAALAAVVLTVTSANTPPAGMASGPLASRTETLADLRSLICIVGSAGVLAFWFIDQRIYQRLLHSVFGYGLYTEFKNPDLPQVRSALYIANLDVTDGLGWFYRVQFAVFLIIAFVLVLLDGAFTWPPNFNLIALKQPVVPITIVHSVFVVCGMIYASRWPSLRGLIKDLYPDLEGALPPRRRDGREQPVNLAKRDVWLARVRAHPVPPETP